MAEAAMVRLNVESKDGMPFELQLEEGFTLQDLRSKIRTQSGLNDVKIFRVGPPKELLKTSDGDLNKLTTICIEPQQRRTVQQIAAYRLKAGKTKASRLLEHLTAQQSTIVSNQEAHTDAQREHTIAVNDLKTEVGNLCAAFDGERVKGDPQTAIECTSQNAALKARQQQLQMQLKKNIEMKKQIKKDEAAAKAVEDARRAESFASMTQDEKEQFKELERAKAGQKRTRVAREKGKVQQSGGRPAGQTSEQDAQGSGSASSASPAPAGLGTKPARKRPAAPTGPDKPAPKVRKKRVWTALRAHMEEVKDQISHKLVAEDSELKGLSLLNKVRGEAAKMFKVLGPEEKKKYTEMAAQLQEKKEGNKPLEQPPEAPEMMEAEQQQSAEELNPEFQQEPRENVHHEDGKSKDQEHDHTKKSFAKLKTGSFDEDN
jgi:hypothetical protein